MYVRTCVHKDIYALQTNCELTARSQLSQRSSATRNCHAASARTWEQHVGHEIRHWERLDSKLQHIALRILLQSSSFELSWVASSTSDPIVPSVHFIWTRFQAVPRVYISEIHWSQRPTKSLYKALRYFAYLQRLTKMPGPSLQKRGASQREGKINKSPKWELPTLILNHQNLTVGKLSTREFIKNSLKTSHYHNHDQRKFSNEQLSTMI